MTQQTMSQGEGGIKVPASRRNLVDVVGGHLRQDIASGLLTSSPHFDWNDYFATVGAPDVQAINVTAPGFFRTLDALLARGSLADVRIYLKWRAIEAAADALGAAFVEERFRYTQALTGAKTILPRWKR